MINFIVVDDEKYFIDEVVNIVDCIMMKNTFEYKTHTFNDFDKEFMFFMKNSLPNKIYILDIETKSASGIDIARMIRKNDMDSVIIFLTAHEELSSTISKEQLMILTFICKFDNFKFKVEQAINNSLRVIGKKNKIKIIDNRTIYTIDINDVLYVTHDSVDRKCLIKTDYAVYKVSKSLLNIKELSLNKLKQTHRGCLVNEDRISILDKKKNEIIFDNGEKIDLLSNNYKKEIV